MNCELAQLRIALGAEGGAGEGADAFAAHIQTCPRCATAANFETALASAMNAVPLPAGLHERLLKSASIRRSSEFRRTVGRFMGLAATILVALGVAGGSGGSGVSQPPGWLMVRV